MKGEDNKEERGESWSLWPWVVCLVLILRDFKVAERRGKSTCGVEVSEERLDRAWC